MLKSFPYIDNLQALVDHCADANIDLQIGLHANALHCRAAQFQIFDQFASNLVKIIVKRFGNSWEIH